MVRWMLKTAAAAAVVALACAGTARAAMITGSVALVPSPGNMLTYTSNNGFLNGATSVTFSTSALEVLNPGTGDLAVLTSGTPGTIVPGTVTEASSNTITVGAFTFEFAGGTFAGNAAFQDAVAFGANGTLSAAGFDDTPATLLISLNQAGGPGNEVSGSLTIAALPAGPATVPEPASLALAGTAGLGLLAVRRRRAANA